MFIFISGSSIIINLEFKNGQRAANTAGQFFKTKQVAADSKIWLNAINDAGDFSQMAVTYNDLATQGVDIYDGKYINDSAFSLSSNINGEEYTIQGRPTFDVNDVVALNFKTISSGIYTIAIAQTKGVFEADQNVYLVDSKMGTVTDLKSVTYTFTATEGIDNARFSLKYQKILKVGDNEFNENSVTVYKNKGIIQVNSGSIVISNIKVLRSVSNHILFLYEKYYLSLPSF